MKPASRTSVAWWRRWTLRDVVVFTLPPMALCVWLFATSIADYARIRRFDDWWSAATSVRKFGYYRVRTGLRILESSALASRLSAERDDLPHLRLFVDRREFDRIDGDVGGHWGEWIEAQIEDNGQAVDAELRFRGDGSAHWGTEKKSFTLKTKRDELYKGFRTMAFSVKDVLPQFLSGSLAEEFGLLAPEQQVVPVYLNDRFYGLHRFVEPIDESFLRRKLRMPGNVFRADTAERGDYFKGLPREVFKNPFIWDRVAQNDRPGAFGTKLLGEWLADLNTSTPEGLQRLLAWHDVDELSRLLAFLLVVGDPYHMSGVHNQFWYEDPVSGTLHPVVWDVRLLDLSKPPRGSNINFFWRQVLRDPRVWTGTMKVLAEKLGADSLLESAAARMHFVAERYADAIAFEQLRSGAVPPIGDVESALAILRKNVETLRGWLNDASVQFVSTRIDAHDLVMLDVLVEGRAPLELSSLDPMGTTHESALALSRLRLDLGLDGNDDSDPEIPIDSSNGQLEGPLRLLAPAVEPDTWELKPRPRHYRLFLSAATSAAADHQLGLVFRNLATGAPVIGRRMAPGTALPSSERIVERPAEASGATPVVLSGDVHMREDLAIDERGSLTIQPGTTLTLDPDVSIECRGKLTALGTAERPITIQRTDPNLPWGVIALQGKQAAGSRFEHVRFLGGGARQVGRVEYKGAVSVHYATGVVFDHCEFAFNQRCDDLINIVKSDASITNSHFHDANADSIDYDMSGGLVAYNTIEGSGNDGLDLMTCWPRVIGNQILHSADKGLSVGEDSAPLVFANRIDGCERGIEVKDRSAPFLLHTTITNCKRGIFAHIKNWRYGEAGWPKLARSLVSGNERDYVAENGARVTLAESTLGALLDSSTGAGELDWVLRAQGVRVADPRPGLATEFELRPPLDALYSGTFEADFREARDGWTMAGDTRRLYKRDHDLIANLARARGGLERAVAWDLSDANLEYVLVLELAGEAVHEVEVSARAAAVEARRAVELAAEATTYRFVTLPLPPGHYEQLAISAEPRSTAARLRLHGWRVYGWPRERDSH